MPLLDDEYFLIFVDDESPDSDHRIGELREFRGTMRGKPFQHEDVIATRVMEFESKGRANRNE